MRTAWFIARVASASLLAGGCTAGPLTLDITVFGDTHSLSYSVRPDGRITVTTGSGPMGAGRDQTLHSGQLAPEEIQQLKQTVWRSGYLMQDDPGPLPMNPGPTMQVEVALGLWQNRMTLQGQDLPSVRSIIAVMNLHLPAQYRLDYRPAGQPQIPGAFED